MSASRVSPPVLNLGLAVAVLLLVVSGCAGSSGDDDSDSAVDITTGGAAATSASASVATESESGDAAAEAAPAESGSDPASADQVQSDWNRLIIRTARLHLEVTDVGRAVTWVRDVGSSAGGYVFSSNTHLQDDQQFAEITIQVPVATFDDTMNQLRGGELVDTVESEESTSQDVSSEFVDNESRIATLRETHARFLELLSKAASVDEILKLEYELQSVREQIETIEGRQQYLGQATSFSTITVSLTPTGIEAPSSAEQATEPGFSFTSIFERSWDHSRGAIEDLLIATIVVSIFTAVFLPIAVIAFVAFRLIRRRVRAIATSNP